jgi:hypothetical protein
MILVSPNIGFAFRTLAPSISRGFFNPTLKEEAPRKGDLEPRGQSFFQRTHDLLSDYTLPSLRRSYLRRINDRGLEGLTTRLTFPGMTYAGCSEIFGPFRQKQLVAALGAFDHRAGNRRVAGIKTHRTFLTRLLVIARIDARRVLNCP